MSRVVPRSEGLVWPGFLLVCGAFFLSFAMRQTIMLAEPLPAAADMGFAPYLIATSGAFYVLSALLFVLGVRAVRRNVRSPA